MGTLLPETLSQCGWGLPDRLQSHVPPAPVAFKAAARSLAPTHPSSTRIHTATYKRWTHTKRETSVCACKWAGRDAASNRNRHSAHTKWARVCRKRVSGTERTEWTRQLHVRVPAGKLVWFSAISFPSCSGHHYVLQQKERERWGYCLGLRHAQQLVYFFTHLGIHMPSPSFSPSLRLSCSSMLRGIAFLCVFVYVTKMPMKSRENKAYKCSCRMNPSP